MKDRKTIGLLLLAVMVGQSFGRFTFALLLPAVKADLARSYGLAGLLGSMNVGAYLVGTALVSVISLRVSLRRIIQTGLVTATTGVWVLAEAPSMRVLIIGMILTGLGGAAVYVPAPALAIAAFAPEKRGLAVGVLGAGIGTGIVIATQLTNVVRALGRESDWRPVWRIEGGLAIVIAVVVLLTLQPKATATASPAPPRLSALRTVPRWPFITAVYACYGLAYILIISFLVAMLQRDARFGQIHTNVAYALVGVFTIPGGILIGRLSDRWGRRRTIVAGFLLTSACPLLFLTHREPWVFLGAAMFGLAFSGNVASIAAYVGDHARPEEFTAAFGAVTLAFGIGQTIGPQFGGWLADHTHSFTATFLVSAGVWLLGALLGTGLAGRDRRSTHSRLAATT